MNWTLIFTWLSLGVFSVSFYALIVYAITGGR